MAAGKDPQEGKIVPSWIGSTRRRDGFRKGSTRRKDGSRIGSRRKKTEKQ
jgi:hypothetical protein